MHVGSGQQGPASSGLGLVVLSEVTASRKNLLLPPTASYTVGTAERGIGLPPGEYVAQLSVTLSGSPHDRFLVNTTFVLRHPPQCDALTVSPRTGSALTTNFALRASATPGVRYTFWYDAGDGSRVPLADLRESESLTGVLLQEGVVVIGCTIVDDEGASADCPLEEVEVAPYPLSSHALEEQLTAELASTGDQTRAVQLIHGYLNIPVHTEEQVDQRATLAIDSIGQIVNQKDLSPAVVAGCSDVLSSVIGSGSLSGSTPEGGKALEDGLLLATKLVYSINNNSRVWVEQRELSGAAFNSIGQALSGALVRPRANSSALDRTVASSVAHVLDRIAIGALVGTVCGELFSIRTNAFEMHAVCAEAATLSGSELGVAGSSFVLPPAAIATAWTQGATDELDVMLTSYVVNPYGWHASAAHAIGEPSELTLRAAGATEPLRIDHLSQPVQIDVPLRATWRQVESDGPPPFGSLCADPSREECEAEVQALNASAAATVRRCIELEGSFSSIWSGSALSGCLEEAQEAQRTVLATQSQCNEIQVSRCSGRGSCNAGGTCDCEMPYYGAGCSQRLQCTFWNGSAFDGSGCVVRDLLEGNVSATLRCECTHLTLFEAIMEVEWWKGDTYTSIAFPMLTLPLSRWSDLGAQFVKLPFHVHALMGFVLLLLSLLLLWADYRDRQQEYIAYMPQWYKCIREVCANRPRHLQ